MAICTACGVWTEPPVLVRDSAGMGMACPHCGHTEPFAQYPLCWIGGSSGSGKSTLVPLLRLCLPGYVVFEGEAIDFWRFDGPPGDYGSLYNQWLKVGYEIALNGCPVVIAATALPAQLEACTMRCRFTTIAYLGLVCRPDTQTARLLHRPAWRNAAAPKFIAAACTFSRQLETAARADPTAIMLHDTTDTRPEASAQEIAAWIRVHLLQP